MRDRSITDTSRHFLSLIDVIVACLSVEQVEPEHNRHEAPLSNSSEALIVMQRTFNPLKRGQYLPGEPLYLCGVIEAWRCAKASDQVQIIRLRRLCRLAAPFIERYRAEAVWRRYHFRRWP